MKSLPMVYEGPSHTLPSPPFNAVQISLDARLEADLNWSEAFSKAEQVKKKGLNILWDLNLGLFDELPLPLSDTTQYKSLHLSLDHFFETLWPKYKENTIGAVLYKGTLDWAPKWNWDPDQLFTLENKLIELFETTQSLYNATGLKFKDFQSIDPKRLLQNDYGKNILRFFCLSTALDYFEILSAQFPSDLLPYVLFDLHSIDSRLQAFQLLEKEAFDFMQVGLKNAPFAMPHAVGWQTKSFLNGYIGKESLDYTPLPYEPTLGVLVPSKPLLDPKKLKEGELQLKDYEAQEPIRFVSERLLTMDWQGLDTLLVFEILPETKRKLEGFIAAGGQVVYGEKPLGLSQEISLKEHQKIRGAYDSI